VPTDLTSTATAVPSGAYRFDSTWKAGTNTTSFKVTLTTAAGTVVDGKTVSATAWSTTAKVAAGSVLTVTVSPYNGTRKGTSITTKVTTPDVKGPTGSFVADDDGWNGVVHQDALSDDVSAASAIVRSIDWGDGAPTVSWTAGVDIEHTYAAQGRYVAVLTLVDEAGNQTRLELPIVIQDKTAPSGAFSVGPEAGWASLSDITITQTSLSDDFSPAGTIGRVVDWKDGTQSTWVGDAPITHVYAVAGTFTPDVTVTDEAGNSATIASTGAATITADVAGPAVRLTLPRRKVTTAATWKTLKGKATDAGVGVARVRVLAVEKRATSFYAYRPATKHWVRAGRTLAGAFQKARPVTAARTADGRWLAPLSGLKLGTLVYRVSATDLVGNASKVLTHKQKLTR
jgi:5'-nucleotidase